MKRIASLVVVAAAAAVPASAPAAPAALPAVKRSLAAKAGGCDTAAYRAPMAGFVSVRLTRGGGDWDLSLLRNGRRVASSRSFGSRELLQTWVGTGERIGVRACRDGRSSRRATASIRLVDAQPPKPSKPSLVRVASPGAALLQQLEVLGFDVTHNMRANWADVVVPGAAALAKLDKLGVKYETRVADLNEQFVKDRRADARYAARTRVSPLPSGREGYRLPDEYQAELKQIVEQFPGLARPVTIGESYQGRPIEGVEIGENVNGTDGRPVYFVMGAHHAREWPSAEIAMEFAWMMVKGYGNDQRITDLLKRERVTLVPLINPDGFFASRMASEDGMFPDPADTTGLPLADTVEGVAVPFGGNLAYRRKNCNGPFPSFEGERDFPCYYQWGVDPNRNYGQNWGGLGAGSDPNTQSYRGDGQWSEPETQAVHEYSQTRPVTTLISIHNVAGLVLRPPGQRDKGLAPDENLLREIGDRMAAATEYTSQYGWQLYDTTGGTEDWNYSAAGTLGYTIEVGPVNGKFHMPYETGVVKEWVGPPGKGGMREALLVGAEAAADERGHSVIEGAAPAGNVLRAKKSFDTPTSPICTYSQGYVRAGTVPPADCVAPGAVKTTPDKLEYTTVVPESGRYEWHVTPSSRPFVSGKYIPGEKLDRTDTYEPIEGEEPDAENGVERTFEVSPGDPITELRLKLEWAAVPEDYDLYLYHVQPDGSRQGIGTAWFVRGALLWTAPGEGTSPNGMYEEIDVPQPPPGTYVARIVYSDSSVANDWKLSVSRTGQRYGNREATGQAEAWTMTCESPDGTVLETRDVIVDRGERANVDICGGTSAAGGGEGAPATGGGEGAPAPAGGVLGTRTTTGRVSISRKAVRLTRRGVAPVRLQCSKAGPCKGVLRLSNGKRLLGKRAYSLAAGQSKLVRVEVTRRTRAATRRARGGYRVTARAGTVERSIKLLGARR